MPINNSSSFFNINNFQNGFNFVQQNIPNNQNASLSPNTPVSPLQNLIPDALQQNKNNNTPLMNVLTNTVAQLKSTTNELAALNEQQTTNMVKDLLKFPKQFEQLVTMLTTDVKLNNSQTALLLLASNMNLSQLSNVLQNSSKEGMANLYKLLANYNQIGVSMKNEQLAHLTKLISFVSAASTSDVQSLKTVMLLYLPWLPLTDPDLLRFEIGIEKTPDDKSIGIDSVGVLLSTKNFGNLQSQILKTDEDGIKIEVISSETFPLAEFAELMKQESKRYSININFDLAKKPEFNKEKIEKSATEVFLNTSPGVNPFLLLISNALIKNVHEIDEKENSRWQEKEKNENGKS
mgnify:CR=1 FL=1